METMTYACIAFRCFAVATAFVVFDVLSGGGFAMIRGDFVSSKMKQGIKNKAGYFLYMAFFVLLDIAEAVIGERIGFDHYIPFTVMCAAMVFWTEVMSVMENIEKTYPGMIPDVVADTLLQSSKKAGVKNVGEHTAND